MDETLLETTEPTTEFTSDELALLDELAPVATEETGEPGSESATPEQADDAAEQTAEMFLSIWERGFQMAAHPKFKFDQGEINSAVRDIAPALDEYGLVLPQSVLRHGKAPVALAAIGGLWNASMLQATELRAQDKVDTLIGQIQAGQEQLAALQEQINQMHQMVNTEGA